MAEMADRDTNIIIIITDIITENDVDSVLGYQAGDLKHVVMGILNIYTTDSNTR